MDNTGGLSSTGRGERVKATVKEIRAVLKQKYSSNHPYHTKIDGLSETNFQQLLGYRWDPPKQHGDERPLQTTTFYKSKEALSWGEADELGLYVGKLINIALKEVAEINSSTGGGIQVSIFITPF